MTLIEAMTPHLLSVAAKPLHILPVDPMNDDMVTQQHLESQETQDMRYFGLGSIKQYICGTKMTGIQYSLLYKAPFYSKYDNFSIEKISFQCIPTGISVGGFCKSGTL